MVNVARLAEFAGKGPAFRIKSSIVVKGVAARPDQGGRAAIKVP
jgi:hypothetical protein